MTQAGESEETCRICLETSPVCISNASKLSQSLLFDKNRLISPCACSGTQAFVHFKCLRKWQSAVMMTRRPGANHSPALICSVCTKKFSIAPPRAALIVRLWQGLTGYSCEVAALFVVLCACYLALAGHNLQTLLEELESGLALVREILPCSFRFNIFEDKCLSRTCSAEGRVARVWCAAGGADGGPCQGCSLLGGRTERSNLHPGTLLVATPAMPSRFFFGSVVLLYEHTRCSGSRGLILNMQSEEKKILEWENEMLPHVDSASILKYMAHGIGGPIAQDEWSILNLCACCTSHPAKYISCNNQQDRETKLCNKDLGQELLPGVFLGRDIIPMLKHVKDGPLILSHQVLHGHAEWFVGQLGSEFKRGLWITKHNASEILFSTPLHELWHVLIRE